MQPDQKEWESFYQSVHRGCGVDFNQYKQEQLRRRILSLSDSWKMDSLASLATRLSANRGDLAVFLDKMAINVSQLFRNPEKWAEVENMVLPELLRSTNRLKCWSAGCSFGAEAYMLSMILDHRFGGPHTILGTDIDLAALAQAKECRFVDADVKTVPQPYLDKYLNRKSASEWRASLALQRYVKFQQGNLLGDRFDRGYDLIMCRNVVIYFNDEAKSALYQKFFDALRPGGYLFVGNTERIMESKEIGFESPYQFFYRKPIEANVRWRNAS